MANDSGSRRDPVDDLLGHGGEPPVAVAERELAEVHQVLPDILDAGLVLAARMDRLDLAVGLQQVQGQVEIAPDMTQQPRLVGQPGNGHQGAVGDLRRVDRAAFAVRTFGILVDAFAQPVVDPGQQQPARPQMVEMRQRLADLPAMVRGVHPSLGQRPGRPPHDRRVLLPRFFGRGLGVGDQQVVADAQVADDERGVRRTVQVADVVETARVLPVGQRVQQGVQRAEQGRAVMVRSARVDVRAHQPQGALGQSTRTGQRVDLLAGTTTRWPGSGGR